MAEREVRTVLTGGGFFEGPRWHDGTWWVSDFYRHTVSRVTADGRETAQFEVPGQPSGMGWLPDGSLVVVSMKTHEVLRWDGSALSTHADLTEHCDGHLNDLVVGPGGHVFAGDFGFDLMGGGDVSTASLTRVDLDGTVSVAAEGLQFPNGSVITPDGGTLVVGETLGNRYTAFDLGADGSLSNRRVWASLGRRSPAARWTRCSASSPSPRTAARSTPTGASGRPTPSAGGSCGWPRAARSSTPSPRRRVWACTPACSAARTAGRC
jgi:sugar lactone lactonase YvrE